MCVCVCIRAYVCVHTDMFAWMDGCGWVGVVVCVSGALEPVQQVPRLRDQY